MKNSKILVIDDEEQLRELITRIIRLEGYIVFESASFRNALKLLEKEKVDVILCDVKLPDGNGVEYTRIIKESYPYLEIILLTAYGNIKDGIQAMKNGAFDYITKGDDNAKILPLLEKATEKVLLQKTVLKLQARLNKYSFQNVIGTSPAISEALSLAEKVAPTNTTVLLLGETGTGKEIFAHAIHSASSRTGKPFMALNCSAFSRDLLESEIFGHKAGAFTGGYADKAGLIEEADGGTLFLDEIGEMALDLQAKFLRVLESAEYIKVGDNKISKVNVRIIAATNKNLFEEISHNRFREDLYYRLNVFSITLPSLRERIEDVPILTHFYITRFSAEINKKIKGITDEALAILKHHSWKGNVRELKNVIERATILVSGDHITTSDLPFEMQHPFDIHSNAESLAEMEKKHIVKILSKVNGNKAEAARILSIGISTLYRKIEEYNII